MNRMFAIESAGPVETAVQFRTAATNARRWYSRSWGSPRPARGAGAGVRPRRRLKVERTAADEIDGTSIWPAPAEDASGGGC